MCADTNTDLKPGNPCSKPTLSFLLSPDAASPRRLLGPLGRIFYSQWVPGPPGPSCFLFSVFQNARPPTTPRRLRPPTDREIKTGRPALPLSPVTREPCSRVPRARSDNAGPLFPRPHVPVFGFSRPGAATADPRRSRTGRDRHRRARFDGGRTVRWCPSISRFLLDSCSYEICCFRVPIRFRFVSCSLPDERFALSCFNPQT